MAAPQRSFVGISVLVIAMISLLFSSSSTWMRLSFLTSGRSRSSCGSFANTPSIRNKEKRRIAIFATDAAKQEESEHQLWLDFRAIRVDRPGNSIWASRTFTECPEVKKELLQLVTSLKEKFTKIGIELPTNRLVEGVVADASFAEEVSTQLKDLNLPVYVASPTFEGEKLPANTFFMLDIKTGLPVALLAPTTIRLSALQAQSIEEVWGFAGKDYFAAKAEEEREEKEYMEKYKEGLDDPSKYILPSKKRLREILGVRTDPGRSSVPLGELFAKTIPPDPILWGRALMKRLKIRSSALGGAPMPKYSLLSDREANPPIFPDSGVPPSFNGLL